MSGLYLRSIVPMTVRGIMVLDVDLADTVDVTPSYTDCVYVFQVGSIAAHEVAQIWLNHMTVSA